MKDLINEYLKDILQKDVKFVLNEKKILRKGKFLLFNIKDYYVTFIIATPKCPRKVYEIYYPFNIVNDVDNKQVIFDYTLDTLTNNEEYTSTILKVAKKSPSHVFLNSLLRIEYE